MKTPQDLTLEERLNRVRKEIKSQKQLNERPLLSRAEQENQRR